MKKMLRLCFALLLGATAVLPSACVGGPDEETETGTALICPAQAEYCEEVPSGGDDCDPSECPSSDPNCCGGLTVKH